MKKLVLTLGLLFMVSSIVFSQTQVLSGSWYGNSETKYYTLHENTGERAFTIEVAFLKPFENKPDVVVGLSNIDAAPGNLRYSIKTKSISRDGFTVEVKTWGDTKIGSIGGFWVAHSNPMMGSEE